jgi:hypothetical protein
VKVPKAKNRRTLVENSGPLKIIIEGKQVWPPLGKIGVHWYEFALNEDGGARYTEFAIGKDGTPDEAHPVVQIEIDKEELQRLVRRLPRDSSRGDSQSRKAVEAALRRLDELRKT